MKLSKELLLKINRYFNNITKEELEESLKEYGVMIEELTIGSKFKQAFPGNNGLSFEIIAINPKKDWCKVLVTNRNNQHWEEEWNDLHFVYSALEIGEYELITPRNVSAG